MMHLSDFAQGTLVGLSILLSLAGGLLGELLVMSNLFE